MPLTLRQLIKIVCVAVINFDICITRQLEYFSDPGILTAT